jgi:hypothetical protein
MELVQRHSGHILTVIRKLWNKSNECFLSGLMKGKLCSLYAMLLPLHAFCGINQTNAFFLD